MVGGAEPSLGILLEYPDEAKQDVQALLRRSIRLPPERVHPSGVCQLGFIGSGNYATQVLIPAFRSAGARLRSVASSGGVSGVHAARKYGFEETTTDADRLLADTNIGAVVVTTRHDSHARFVIRALELGKHVFVEKPLCLTPGELEQIEGAWRASRRRDAPGQDRALGEAGPLLMVGFNRRFSPLVAKLKDLIAGVKQPRAMVMTVNAGAIPADHWTQDPQVGGGRIIGEACHFIDLLRDLAASPITAIQVTGLGASPGGSAEDKATFTLSFADGSMGTVHYLANGHKSFPKERLEVFTGGRILQIDNFRVLRGHGWPGFSRIGLWRQDKGQHACAAAFLDAIEQGGSAPIPFEEILEVTRASFEIAERLR